MLALPFLLLLILLPATLPAAQFLIEKEVALVIDGQPRQVRSRAGLVSQLLREQGVTLRAGDFVEPQPLSLLHAGQQVRVNHVRSVTLTVDGATRILRTWHSEPAAILAAAGLQPAPGDALFVNGQRIDPAQSDPPAAVITHLELRRQRSFRLHEGATTRILHSSARTVGEALPEAGITLHPADGLQPPADTALVAGMDVRLTRALPLTIVADGLSRQTRALGSHVADALDAAGLTLAGLDYSIPAADAPLLPGMLVRVIRVREEVEYEQERLPHSTRTQVDAGLELDQRRVLQQGQDGIRGVPQRVRYENGVEISRETGAAEVLQPPRDHIIGVGSKIVLRSVNTPAGPRQYWRVLRMKATSYHPASVGGSTTTATGATLRKGIIASNPAVIPYGSEVYVAGYGIGSMQDTAAAWYVQQQPMFIDLGYSDADYRPWSQWVDVYLLTPVPVGRYPLTLPG